MADMDWFEAGQREERRRAAKIIKALLRVLDGRSITKDELETADAYVAEAEEAGEKP